MQHACYRTKTLHFFRNGRRSLARKITQKKALKRGAHRLTQEGNYLLTQHGVCSSLIEFGAMLSSERRRDVQLPIERLTLAIPTPKLCRSKPQLHTRPSLSLFR